MDCVISIIIITINIINKVLSALFLLPRLSSPNIYKYRTVPRRRRNRVRGGQIRKEGKGEGGQRKVEEERWRGKKARTATMLEMRKGREEGAKQSGQYHRLQKALASCVQTGGCVCSLRAGGRWWRRRSTGTLAREARGRRRRGGVGGGAEGKVPGLPL